MSPEFSISFEFVSIIEEISFSELERDIGLVEEYSIHSLGSFVKDNTSVFEFFRDIRIRQNYITYI